MRIVHNQDYKRLIIWSPLILSGVPSIIYHDACLIIENGIIKEIQEGIPIDNLHHLKNSRDANLIIADNTLMPGMIDCHVHLALNGINFKLATEQWENQEIVFSRFECELDNYLKAGILTIRDGGDKKSLAHNYKFFARNKHPQIISTGFAIFKHGYYGSFLGKGVDSIKEIPPLLDQLITLGVNQIKVIVSGIVSFKDYGKVGQVQWTLDELKEIAKISHEKGLKVMGHASSHEAVALAIKAGVDTIEHGYFLNSDDLEEMAKYKIPWIPTVIPVAAQTFLENKANFSQEEIEVITKTYRLHLEKIKEGFDLGVIIGIGTDAGASGVLHGLSYFRELDLFRQAGIGNSDIIRAATIYGSIITGTEKYLGEISIGKTANLIGVHGNPLNNLNSLREVELIIV